MREHIDATTTARDLVRAREEAIRERRRAEFYGLSAPSPLPYRRHAVYIFQPDDLDNPEVIRMVEIFPHRSSSPGATRANRAPIAHPPLPNHPPPIRNNLTNMSDNASNPNEKKRFEPLVENHSHR